MDIHASATGNSCTPRAPTPVLAAVHCDDRTIKKAGEYKPRVGVTVDGFALLKFCKVQHPSEAESCSAKGKNIVSVVAEDAAFFKNLKRLDFSENQIMLEDMTWFTHLEHLRLACNGIMHIAPLQNTTFTQLTTLDLSYNALTTEAIRSLVPLLRLKSLNLSYNNLGDIPTPLVDCINITTLDLSFNALTNDDCIETLAAIPKLRHVNLNNNSIRMRKMQSLAQDDSFKFLETLSLENNKCASTNSCLPALVGKVHFRTLRISGNPCAMDGNFVKFLKACTWETAKVFVTVPSEENELAIQDVPLGDALKEAEQHGAHPAIYGSDSFSHFIETTTLPTMAQWRTYGLNSRFGKKVPVSPSLQGRFSNKEVTLKTKYRRTTSRSLLNNVPTFNEEGVMEVVLSAANSQYQDIPESEAENEDNESGFFLTEEKCSVGLEQNGFDESNGMGIKTNSRDVRTSVPASAGGLGGLVFDTPNREERYEEEDQVRELEAAKLRLVAAAKERKKQRETLLHSTPDTRENDFQHQHQNRGSGRLGKAISDLRYALHNPLTSDQDIELAMPQPHHQKLKAVNKLRAVPRKRYVPKPPRKTRLGYTPGLASTQPLKGLADIEHILDTIEQHGRDIDGVVFDEHKEELAELSQKQGTQLDHLIGVVDDMIDTYGNEERGV